VVLIIMENHGYGPSGSCRTNDVPYPSTLPALAPFRFITPNIYHDMHSCAISTGDTWLSHHVPHLAGTRDGTRYSHYGLLGGLEAHFGVRELRNAATANTLPV
jgi:hypothetical protein